jgi:hypothetical protein
MARTSEGVLTWPARKWVSTATATAVQGVVGDSFSDHPGVRGASGTGRGVEGESNFGIGVFGTPDRGDGVQGISPQEGNSGVAGIHSGAGHGVYGQSAEGDGVFGTTPAPGMSGVAGLHQGNGNGIYGRSERGFACHFDGDVKVTGTVTTGGGDCAEDFDVAVGEPVAAGTVMVTDAVGTLRVSETAYDNRVVGVVSGAGAYSAGMVLDRHEPEGDRVPIALLGKVYCKVDAGYSPIEAGDLLTTSPTQGHAMKAVEPLRAFGSVIGKALLPHESGQGLIPIVIALQ